jgi:hypothetical protein
MTTEITRKIANDLILEELKKANNRWGNQDLRFGQLLLMAGFKLGFEDLYVESTTVLEKVKGENNGF